MLHVKGESHLSSDLVTSRREAKQSMVGLGSLKPPTVGCYHPGACHQMAHSKGPRGREKSTEVVKGPPSLELAEAQWGERGLESGPAGDALGNHLMVARMKSAGRGTLFGLSSVFSNIRLTKMR